MVEEGLFFGRECGGGAFQQAIPIGSAFEQRTFETDSAFIECRPLRRCDGRATLFKKVEGGIIPVFDKVEGGIEKVAHRKSPVRF